MAFILASLTCLQNPRSQDCKYFLNFNWKEMFDDLQQYKKNGIH